MLAAGGIGSRLHIVRRGDIPQIRIRAGVLQRRHIVAGELKYCGMEFKRKLEQGPVDHEMNVRCKVYESGRVAAAREILRLLAQFSEGEIENATGLHSKPC